MSQSNSPGGCATTIAQFAGVDIYLIDQILKGNFPRGSSILDAGCGAGRNLTWFLCNGYDVHGVDQSGQSISHLQITSAQLAPALPLSNFKVASVEEMPYPDASFDAVLSIAVLHFAKDEATFQRMLAEMWRVLKPGGMLFVRLGSTMGITNLLTPISPRRYLVPDGSTRFLVDLDMLMELSQQLGATQLEPIKTVNVQNLRCMTTWVLQKN